MRQLNNERGITLLEVLAASAILAIIVLAVMQVSGYNMLASHKSDRTVQAQRAAEQVLNTIRKDVNSGSSSQYMPLSGTYTCNNTMPNCDMLPPHSQMTIERQAFTGTAVVMSPDPSVRQVHLQAIVLQSNAPQLVTVSLTWEERQ